MAVAASTDLNFSGHEKPRNRGAFLFGYSDLAAAITSSDGASNGGATGGGGDTSHNAGDASGDGASTGGDPIVPVQA